MSVLFGCHITLYLIWMVLKCECFGYGKCLEPILFWSTLSCLFNFWSCLKSLARSQTVHLLNLWPCLKDVPWAQLAPCHEGIEGTVGIVLCVVKLRTRLKSVVSFLLRLLYLGERAPGTHWIVVSVGLRVRLDPVEKRKFLTLLGLEIKSLVWPAHSQSLYWLHCHPSY
jgi:hypothetical protein